MITICFTVFAIVLCYLVYNFNIDTQDQKQFDDMAQTITVDKDNETDNNDNGIESLIAENSDCLGWLRISGTKIDYPIMQTKGNPQYYLRRDFNKQYSYMGTPFMDSRCDMNYDNNLIVYGHNMRDGKTIDVGYFANDRTEYHLKIEYTSTDDKQNKIDDVTFV